MAKQMKTKLELKRKLDRTRNQVIQTDAFKKKGKRKRTNKQAKGPGSRNKIEKRKHSGSREYETIKTENAHKYENN